MIFWTTVAFCLDTVRGTGYCLDMDNATQEPTMTDNTTITGTEAIEFARATGCPIHKHADPTDGARRVELAEAADIAREDASLLYVQLGMPMAQYIVQLPTRASAAAALSRAEHDAGVDVDQDWAAETTTIIFPDDSRLVMDGILMRAEGEGCDGLWVVDRDVELDGSANPAYAVVRDGVIVSPFRAPNDEAAQETFRAWIGAYPGAVLVVLDLASGERPAEGDAVDVDEDGVATLVGGAVGVEGGAL